MISLIEFSKGKDFQFFFVFDNMFTSLVYLMNRNRNVKMKIMYIRVYFVDNMTEST